MFLAKLRTTTAALLAVGLFVSGLLIAGLGALPERLMAHQPLLKQQDGPTDEDAKAFGLAGQDGVKAVKKAAQPQAGSPQPDRLHLGTVYVGATIEASFLIREEGPDPNITLDVVAPKFVKVLAKSTDVRPFGPEWPQKDFVFGHVEMAFDTSAAGVFSGELSVTLGRTIAKVPVSATVKASRPGLSRVLVAGTPFHQWSTNDGTKFEAWTKLVADSPLDVNYLLVGGGKPVFRDLNLEDFETLFLTADGLVSATPKDIRRAREHAEKGGRVIVAADRSIADCVEQANAVLLEYGLRMRAAREIWAAGRNDVTLGKEFLDPRLVKAGVHSLHFVHATPTTVTDANRTQILVRAIGVGENGDGFVVRAQAGKGEVITLGQSLWWNWIGKERAQGSDNAKLLQWLLASRPGA